ncbi:hypothetical protein BBW65_06680 [Helicobacter enhydrae]|uniref:Tetratricopeptide repeat protein n=1 Tax=Helicobacter enhydrae TaxID=222136 RepID=A0A1B1U6X9_9HELI|nr:tetratricopeptide repeat protein [Helicobacter enhydrae]ANV98496.1 hypothetical protein BBW65_06680 [Helicobacter enhydrae]
MKEKISVFVEKLKGLKDKLKHIAIKIKDNLKTKENKMSLYVVLGILGVALLFVVISAFRQDSSTQDDIQASQSGNAQTSKAQANAQQNNAPIGGGAGVVLQSQADEQLSRLQLPNQELESLIQKANILYENGHIDDALEVFDKIALYSQSLANYNLGAIQLVEKKYSQAIRSFDQAIAGGEDVSLSAVNAGYSALKLGDMEKFKHYIDVAYTNLPYSYGSPFYSYLYAEVLYYKNQYFEALSPLLNPNSKSYIQESDQLASEMFLVFGDDYNALEKLKQSRNPKDKFALGMLYARVGDYAKAEQTLRDYLVAHPEDYQAIWAKELVDIKARKFGSASATLKQLDELKIPQAYKIVTGLNENLFDVKLAQKKFWDRNFEHHRSLQYKILFYYAPYKVFNANEAFEILSEGNFNFGANLLEQSVDFYKRGGTISKINRNIAEGIREVYSGDLRKALKYFEGNAKQYPQYSVLYYDTGLLYAQFGDFEKAYSYFSRAYFLDNTNIFAGIFAIMAGQFIYQDTSRISASIATDFKSIDSLNQDESRFLQALFEYVVSGTSSSLSFPNTTAKKKAIYFAFDAVNAMNSGDIKKASEAFQELDKIFHKDLTTDIMLQVALNYGQDLQKISLRFSTAFRKGDFSNLHSLYYGGSLARELFVYLAFVTGNLSYVIGQLQDRLVVEDQSVNGILQALGLAYIYNREFEKAFSTYNDLIDKFGENDARTKFLGSVAAIGAGHYNNAVALLQISKIQSPVSFESRYALALLYQQIGNLRSASSLFATLDDKNFVSEFFDFKIDTSELIEALEKGQEQPPKPQKVSQKP